MLKTFAAVLMANLATLALAVAAINVSTHVDQTEASLATAQQLSGER